MTTADICLHPWNYAVEPFRIAGNLFYVGNRDVSSHLIATDQGLVLLDTTYPQTLYLLLESIRQLGFDPRDLAYILHCHGHYDHCGGTRGLVGLTSAQTALGAPDCEILTTRPELSWAPEYGVEFHEAFDVDLPLAHGDLIRLGKTSIECLATPGHTPGTMSYFFDIEENRRTYHVGIHGGPGLNTLSREYLAEYGLPETRRNAYLQSLDQLKRRAVDIFIGAHPHQNATFAKRARMNAGDNPFVDPTAWPTFLGALEADAKVAFEPASHDTPKEANRK